MKSSAERIFSWLLVFLLPVFAVYPALFSSIEEHAYDAAEFHVLRGIVFSNATANGSFYPRWVQPINGGLGGPLFEFYSPLPYFLLDLLNRLGIAHPIGWRILTAMALLAASTGMFGLALTLFRRADVALVSAAIFCYNSYLLRDLFERGSPQGWAVALLPWLLWLILRATEKPSIWRMVLASICFAAIILVHNATAALLMPVVAIFLLFLILRKRRRAFVAVVSLVMGLALAGFYLIPYIAEIQFVQFDNPLFAGYTLPAANPLRLQDFLSLPRVFDIGLGNNAMAESGGLFHAAVLVLAIPVLYTLVRQRHIAEVFLVAGSWALGILVIWMQTDSATAVWKTLPALNVFQFRWRLLSILGYVSAIILGFIFARMQPRLRSICVSLLITFYVLLQLPSLYPDLLFRYIRFSPRPTIADAQAFALESNAAGLTSFNEYLPRWRQLPITEYASSPISNLPVDAKILNNSTRTGFVQTKIETPAAFIAAMNVLYYPGWIGKMDEQAAPIRPTERSGLIAIDVPAGQHTLELRYEGTSAQHLGDGVSLGVVFGLVVLAFFERRRASTLDEAGSTVAIDYLAPRWWIPTLIVLLALLKAFWIDPQTTLFRAASTCDAIQDAVVQTNIRFGDRVRLCGYVLPRTQFMPNDELRVTLYWQVESPATADVYSFVHLLGDKFNPETNNPLWGQQDKTTPAEHTLTAWVPDKLYRDEYAFRVAANAPSGDYRLEIGWQDTNAQRLNPSLSSKDSALSISDLKSLLLAGIHIQ